MVRIEINIKPELLKRIINICERTNVLNLNQEISFYIEEGIKAMDEECLEDDDDYSEPDILSELNNLTEEENNNLFRKTDTFMDVN
jgi:hypothetical protein